MTGLLCLKTWKPSTLNTAKMLDSELRKTCQYHPFSGGGCSRKSEIWSPRCSDGNGWYGLCAVESISSLWSWWSWLEESWSFCPLCRSCFDAALFPAHPGGYKLSMDELKILQAMEQPHSRTSRICLTPGVECTTGPLDSGSAMPQAWRSEQKWWVTLQQQRYQSNRFRIFVLCSDGDMQEGIASETASWAGHLGLGIWRPFTTVTISPSQEMQVWRLARMQGKRFEAWVACSALWWTQSRWNGRLSWRILSVANGPSLIVAKTVIGKGHPPKKVQAGSHEPTRSRGNRGS